MKNSPNPLGVLFDKTGRTCFQRENIIPLLTGSLIFHVLVVLSLGILWGPLSVGYAQMCLDAARGEPITTRDVFGGFDLTASSILLSFISFIAFIIGIAFVGIGVVVPLIWLSYSYYVLADDGGGAFHAIEESIALSNARLGITALVAILALVTYIFSGAGVIGTLLFMPFAGVMFAFTYEDAVDEREAQEPARLPAVAELL